MFISCILNCILKKGKNTHGEYSHFSNTVNGEYKIADMYYSSDHIVHITRIPKQRFLVIHITIPSKLMNSMHHPSNQSKEARCVMLLVRGKGKKIRNGKKDVGKYFSFNLSSTCPTKKLFFSLSLLHLTYLNTNSQSYFSKGLAPV